MPTSDNSSATDGSIFDQWGRVFLEGGNKFGQDLQIYKRIRGYLEDTGFETVVEYVYEWPIRPWGKDPYVKEIGLWNQLHKQGWPLALFIRVLGARSPPSAQSRLEAYGKSYSGPTPRYRSTSPRCVGHLRIAKIMPIISCRSRSITGSCCGPGRRV